MSVKVPSGIFIADTLPSSALLGEPYTKWKKNFKHNLTNKNIYAIVVI